MSAFFAFQTRYSQRLHVKPHDDQEVIAALQSPSVVWLIRFFEAINYDEALAVADQIRREGKGETTFGGMSS